MRTLIAEATATGAGPSKALPEAKMDHGVDCLLNDTNNSISVVVVDLEGSLDPPEVPDNKAKWIQLGQKSFDGGEITAKYAMWVINATPPVKRVRANLITLTGIASPDTVRVRHQIDGDY